MNKTNEAPLLLVTDQKVKKMVQSLPKAKFMGSKLELVYYEGFWVDNVKHITDFQRHFQARDSDLILCSLPKTGTTWMKSLLFSVANRSRFRTNQSPLLTHNPHQLVPLLEHDVYGGNPLFPSPEQLGELPSPRLLHSHAPYESLPMSMRSSACKIVYVARNPMDTLVSYWHFFPMFIRRHTGEEDFQPSSIHDFFEDFYDGAILHGPYFEHLLGYWKQSLEHPKKVLFLKYEDLKDDPVFCLKKLAEFVGLPFSPEEERAGIIEEIIELCSIKTMKNLEVNKSGLLNQLIDKSDFFRKGQVGDWINYFTPSMMGRMTKLMKDKFGGSGLSFPTLFQE